MPLNALNSCSKSGLKVLRKVPVLVKKRKLKNPEFWVCRLKCRGIAIAMPSRAAILLPGNLIESSQGAGRGIGLGRAAALTSRMLFFGVLRLENGVLMSGIDTATLISVERCPRHLIMDLNPIRHLLTRYL